MKEKINLRICNDTLFKKVFAEVPNALISLVSVCLDIDYNELKDNTKLELNELPKNNINNKSTFCDFVIKIGNSFKLNIEVNNNNYVGLSERNILFLSRLYSNFIPRGIKYSDLPKYKVAQLNINNFSNPNGKIISRMFIMDEEDKTISTDALFYYNFDIEKCKKIYYNEVESNIDRNSKLIKWGALLCTTNLSDIKNIIGDDLMEKEDKEKFVKVVSMFSEEGGSFTEEEMEEWARLKLEGEIHGAEEKGTKIGTETTTTNHIKNMLKENIEIDIISKVTGVSKEDILKIKNNL